MRLDATGKVVKVRPADEVGRGLKPPTNVVDVVVKPVRPADEVGRGLKRFAGGVACGLEMFAPLMRWGVD